MRRKRGQLLATASGARGLTAHGRLYKALAAATLVVIGSIAELAHLTTGGRTGLNVALAATVILAGAMVAPFAFGFGPLWVALAVGALLVLILTARPPTPAVAQP